MHKKRARQIIAFFLALVFLIYGWIVWKDETALAASDGMLRVLLTRVGTNLTTLSMKTTCAYAIGSASGEQIASGSTVKLLLSGGSLYLSANGETHKMGTSAKLYRLSKGNVGVQFTSPKLSNVYCGDMLFTINGGSIQSVVRIYVEDYLYGVVAYEMSDSFPIEALKAQAVCARTYALRLKKSGGSYDLTDNTTNQVYKGFNASYKNVIAAVDATRGQCLLTGNKYAGCWYTASNGGQTESTKNMWGSSLSYSTVKDDPYDLENPSSVAKKHTVYKDSATRALNGKLSTLLKAALASQLNKLGLSTASEDIAISEVVSIEPHAPKYAEPSRTYTKLRFGLKVSSRNAQGERQGVAETLYVDLGTYTQLAKALSLDIASTTYETVYVEEKDDAFDIVFRRYGHGVGMSQRGAQQMARKYEKSYQQILEFYFTGTTLKHLSLIDATTTQAGAATPQPEKYTTLSYGDKGDDVKRLQKKLKELGYFDDDITGNFLKKTKAALEAFQSANGFIPDGIATPQVQEKLFAAMEDEPLSPTREPAQSEDLSSSGSMLVDIPEGAKLRVYSKADYASKVLGTLTSRTIVHLYGFRESWAGISGGGLKGYVNKMYLSAPESAEHTPAPTDAPTQTAPTAAPNQDSTVTPTQNPTTTSAPTHAPSGDLLPAGFVRVSVADGMRLGVYSQANKNSKVVGTLADGTIVQLFGYKGEWAGISGNGVKGYVYKTYLKAPDGSEAPEPTQVPEATQSPAPTPAPEPPTGDGELKVGGHGLVKIPQGASLRVFARASTSADKVGSLKRGDIVQIYGLNGTWAAVSNGLVKGYVNRKYLVPADPEQEVPAATAKPAATPTPPPPLEVPEEGEIAWNARAKVRLPSTGMLSLRLEPKQGAMAVAYLSNGEKLTVHARCGEWVRVSNKTKMGYVPLVYLQIYE